jgi:hypothetical protein
LFCTIAFGGVAAIAMAASASALTIRRDAKGTLAPVAVVASGFKPGAQVYAEQCNGVAPTTPLWSPTIDCDLGTSPSPVTADAQGRAVFSLTDPNHFFRPVDGESPSRLFNCVGPGEKAPADQLKTFPNCQVRVSTNNATVTLDQVFIPMAIPPPGTHAPSAASMLPRANAATHGHAATAPRAAAQPARSGSAASAPTSGAQPIHAQPIQTSCSPDCPAPASSHGAGVIAFTDSGVALGYGMFTVGLVIVIIAVMMASRRRPTAVPPPPKG